MDGTVIEASSKGDYGIHLKIQNNDVVVVYAHCSELLVKEGEKVNQGMEIEKLGQQEKQQDHICILKLEGKIKQLIKYLLQF